MEIYKLSDDIPGERGKRATDDGLTNKHKRDIMVSNGGDFGVLKIADIKQGVRNENRVNIYVNGKYSFSLDIAQVVDLKVKIGRELTEAELDELKRASEYGKLYQRALEWVLVRPRSVRELKDYLKRKGADFSDVVVERLVAKGYVDDGKFARYYVENRFVKKGVSERRLRLELQQKGVAREIVDEVLENSDRDDTEEIRKMIARKRAKYDDEKLIAYLCRQGFSYDLVRELVREANE
ncbi:RecX family transcriptional regulator [Candidatus Saccharibacteria bacterium]|nr:RecX family transcriptional regulator [Candidatus Saccharibacteria bacterium]